MAEALLLVATGLQVANTISGSRREYTAIKQQSEFQASQLETNQRISELQANSAESRGAREAKEIKTKTKLLIGRQRASLAAQGIQIDTGSALDIQLETAELGAVDEMTIRNNAFREATGYRIQAIDTGLRASLTRKSGKSRARSTLITGGLTAANQAFSGARDIKFGR